MHIQREEFRKHPVHTSVTIYEILWRMRNTQYIKKENKIAKTWKGSNFHSQLL